MGTIYIATNLVNQKQYVGQTVQRLKRRFKQHQVNKNKTYFDNALKKYGMDNFRIVKFDCPFELLNDYECFWIKKLSTLSPNGYNLTSGGEGGFTRSEITCQKISESKKGTKRTEESKKKQSISVSGEKNHFFGKEHTEETKKIIKEKNQGKKRTEESREKQSISVSGKKNPMYGRTKEKHPLYGKMAWNKGIPHTEEAKRKISQTLKGRRHKPNSIKKMSIIAKNRWNNMTEEKRKKIGNKISEAKRKKGEK